MITNPEKSMQGVVLKFPDAKFFLILSYFSGLGMALQNNNFEASPSRNFL